MKFEKFKNKIIMAGHSNEKVKMFQDMINGKDKDDKTFVVEGIWCLDYYLYIIYEGNYVQAGAVTDQPADAYSGNHPGRQLQHSL